MNLVDFKDAREALKIEMNTSKYGIFDQMEKQCIQKEKFISEQTKSIKDMHHNCNYLIEYKEVLNKVSKFMLNKPKNIRINRNSNPFDNEEHKRQIINSAEQIMGRPSDSSDDDAQIGTYNQPKILNLSSIAGIIDRDEVQRMKRIIFRASRGNALVHSIQIEKSLKDYSGVEIPKDVYIITFQEGESLRAKLTRVCESFNSDNFQIPTEGYHDKVQDVKTKIKETRYLINTTTNEMKLYLEKVCKMSDTSFFGLGISRLSLYKMVTEYDRSVYNNLNKLMSKKALFQGYFWSTSFTNDILKRLDFEGQSISEIELEDCYNHNIPPPTHFRTNEFLKPFQDIVDTYGIPNYKEANPTVFAIISFPFLFGVMFGDIGHGGMLFAFGAFLCLFAERLKGTALQTMVDIRYMIVLLGFFATFCG